MKETSLADVETVALQAKSLCDIYGAALYINDHVETGMKVKATGVHLGKLDMSPSEARTLAGDGYIIGGTANTWEDILELYRQGVDYIGLGPFRFTATKKNLSPVLGMEGYRNIIRLCRKNEINLPIVAVGGITLSDIPELMSTGISGIALSSAILNAEDPIEETKKIVSICNN
jgi:thiamine-phosphate pyrophosphorylase